MLQGSACLLTVQCVQLTGPVFCAVGSAALYWQDHCQGGPSRAAATLAAAVTAAGQAAAC